MATKQREILHKHGVGTIELHAILAKALLREEQSRSDNALSRGRSRGRLRKRWTTEEGKVSESESSSTK